jgi:hypothetical protein
MKYLMILLLLIGCSVKCPSEPKFKLGDQVTVLSGRFVNCTGIIVNYQAFCEGWPGHESNEYSIDATCFGYPKTLIIEEEYLKEGL